MVADRRLAPRVSCSIPAELTLFMGPSVDVLISDISTIGCQITGDPALLKLESVVSRAPLEVDISFGLDGCPIHARCRVMHKHRESQTQCVAGLRWGAIADHHLKLIREFVERRLG